MTVSYQYDVASSTSGGFTRLLFKWKGSLYKLVYREFLLFVVAYGIMSIVYRHFFTDEQKRSFERLALYCDTFMNYIPLSFILGFYVSFVASRWWQQYMAIPWPDKLLHAIALHVTGYDERGRMLRRSMVRYLNLSFVLVLRSISSAVKRRFPTFDHIVEAGFMTTTELQIYKTIPSTEFNTYWVPFTWFTALVKEARYTKRIADPHGSKLIMEEFCGFRHLCGMLWSYDWVSIPLVYTQVVTIATYSFFIACIIGRQYVEKSPIPYKVKADLYIPYFTLLQFFFYMGLLKVAEQLINPFGDDDEDFELNWIIDRHMKVSYLIVDTLLLRTPPLSKDIYYDQECPVLPYTEAAVPFRKKAYRGSVAHMTVPEDQQTLILPDIEEETEECNDGSEDAGHKSRISGGLLSSATGMMFSQGQQATAPSEDSDCVTLNIPEVNVAPKASVTSKLSSAINTRRGSRLGVSAGTKGSVGSAVVAVGANQVLLAAGPESLSHVRNEDHVDYVMLPLDSISQCDIEPKSPSLSRSHSFKLAASIKSKLAMRKKPVMKWKPYHRPAELTKDTDEEHMSDGCYEEECAFMWRTIEEDGESSKHFISPSDHSRDFRRSSAGGTDRFLSQQQDDRILSSYTGTRPRAAVASNRLSFPESKHPSVNFTHTSYRRHGSRRTRREPRHTSWSSPGSSQQGSLPLLPCASCGVAPLSPHFVRSVSENSIFIDAVVERLRSIPISENDKYAGSQRGTSKGKHRRKVGSPRSRHNSYEDL